MITVADVLRDALPAGAALIAGQVALNRQVSWAVSLRLRGGFMDLEPSAIALINLDTLRLLASRPSVAQTVEALGRAEAAAVAVRGEIDPYQLSVTMLMAERARCALVQLPCGRAGAVAAVELAVNSYLADRRGGHTPARETLHVSG